MRLYYLVGWVQVVASKMQKPYLGQDCTVCNIGTFQEPINGQEWHLTCDHCNTILWCYTPQDYQAEFHKDRTKIKGFFGGYGSGKTTTCCAETIRHVLETPNGTTLIGAATLPQLENTAQKEFFEMFPADYIKEFSKQKNRLITINGHTVIFRPLDDESKARSLNLTFVWIEEASEVDYAYFVQLQTRLRNHATTEHGMVLSSNPDLGWIKTEVLLKSANIYNAKIDYMVNPDEVDENISSHIAPTELNKFLPPNFYEDVAKNKPDWWVARYLHGSFENREGLVYPQLQDASIYVEPFEIPLHWQRYMALDFGIKDPTATLWGAVDPKDGLIYFYKEHYESNKPVNYHADIINKENSKIPYGRLFPPVADPSGQNRSMNDMFSMFDHYAEYGVYLTEASNRLEDGISKVYTYLELGKVRIFNNLKWFRWEAERYKYPEQKLENSESVAKRNVEKPVDRDNHLMDTFRYVIQELPDNPEDLLNPSYGFDEARVKEEHLPHALQDEYNDYGAEEDWLAYY